MAPRSRGARRRRRRPRRGTQRKWRRRPIGDERRRRQARRLRHPPPARRRHAADADMRCNRRIAMIAARRRMMLHRHRRHRRIVMARHRRGSGQREARKQQRNDQSAERHIGKIESRGIPRNVLLARKNSAKSSPVIPAKAGIQNRERCEGGLMVAYLDPRLRGDDGTGLVRNSSLRRSPDRNHTLKRNSITSPSWTTYSLPSWRSLPASRAPASPPSAT